MGVLSSRVDPYNVTQIVVMEVAAQIKIILIPIYPKQSAHSCI